MNQTGGLEGRWKLFKSFSLSAYAFFFFLFLFFFENPFCGKKEEKERKLKMYGTF